MEPLRAASWMLVLCGANIAPALLVAALGYSAASTLGQDQRFSFPVALVLSLLIFDLPLGVSWFLLRRGNLLGKILCIVFPGVLLGILILLVLSVWSGGFLTIFKVLCGLLAGLVGALYGWGVVLGIRALRTGPNVSRPGQPEPRG